MREILCLYHDDCFDGLAAAWVLKKAFAENQYSPEVRFQAVNYHQPPPVLRMYTDAYILDFSYETEVLKQFIRNSMLQGLTLLDHHPRSEKIVDEVYRWSCEGNIHHKLLKNLRLVYEEYSSGALMTWEHFFPDTPAPAIIQFISDRDLWQFKHPLTREVIDGLSSYPLTLEAWSELFATYPTDSALITHLLERAPIARAMNENQIAWAIKYTRRDEVIPAGPWMERAGLPVKDMVVPVINAPHGLLSEALTRLAGEDSFAMGYYDMPEGRKFSVRSKNINIREFVRQFPGGDGHEHAGGFTIPADQVSMFF